MGKTKKRTQTSKTTSSSSSFSVNSPSSSAPLPSPSRSHEDIKKDKKSKINHYIGSSSQADHFVKDNKYILHGYRVNFDSPKKIFKSLFILHNELVNIWSHLLGALLVLVLIIYIGFYLQPSIPFIKNEIEKDISMIFSPIYNQISNIEEKLNNYSTETIHHIKHDYIDEYNKELVDKYIFLQQSLNQKLSFISEEIEAIKANINDEAVVVYDKIHQILGNYTDHLLDDVSQLISEPFANDKYLLKIAKNYTSSVINGVDNVKSSIIETIDSDSYDWIDIYKSFRRKELKPFNHHHVSRWPIFVFLVSAILCLLFSAFYHLFLSMNLKTSKRFHSFDYAGISLLISGSTFPPFVYTFFCRPVYYIVYLSIVGSACLVVFIFALFDTLHKPEYRKWKGVVYGSLGVFAGFPIIHILIDEIFRDETKNPCTFIKSVKYFITMGACYLTGLAIYVFQCPERFKPGTFDIWGSSHQLWHLMIVIAIIVTYFGSLETFYVRQSCSCQI